MTLTEMRCSIATCLFVEERFVIVTLGGVVPICRGEEEGCPHSAAQDYSTRGMNVNAFTTYGSSPL